MLTRCDVVSKELVQLPAAVPIFVAALVRVTTVGDEEVEFRNRLHRLTT